MSTQINEEDFEKIYRETYNKTLKFAIIKCNNLNDVNDIIQDTYIELYNKLKKNSKIELNNIDGFIYGIANNVIKRHYFKKKKEKVVNLFNDQNEEMIEIKDDFDLEQNIITKENVKEVWDFLKKKDLITAKIFNLYFALDMKISEIAKELQIHESNVKNRIYRTLKEIKKELGKENEND